MLDCQWLLYSPIKKNGKKLYKINVIEKNDNKGN